MLFPASSKGYIAAKAKEDGEIQADEAKSKFGQDFMYFRQVSPSPRRLNDGLMMRR
jgi:hypothetical protein